MSPLETSSPRAIQSNPAAENSTDAPTSISDSSDPTKATTQGKPSSMSSVTMLAHERPRLPPIMSIDEFHRGLHQPPMLSPSAAAALYNNPFRNLSPVSSLVYNNPDQSNDRYRPEDTLHPVCSPFEITASPLQTHSPTHGFETQAIPTKRPYGIMSQHSDRYNQSYSHAMDTSTPIEAGLQTNRPMYASLPPASRSSLSGHIALTRHHCLAATNSTDYSSSQISRSNAHRCSLFIRQQPRAARAGPDGKDRRAIDPPPVLQLMINDFDPKSEDDINELRSSYFVVHCRLISANSPKRDMSTLSSTNDDGTTEVQRLLLGTSVASPFFCADDPNLETMPTHPRSDRPNPDQGPPSPTSRFIMPRGSPVTNKPTTTEADAPSSLPGMFFIFADLSIRRAGEYRLEFCLMKVEPSTMVAGSKLPILHSITSQVFRVVNAKDFDQVQPSTDLVKGLLDRGAGFPLKLKKGTREGGRRRTATDSEGGGGSVEGIDGDDEDEDDDDD